MAKKLFFKSIVVITGLLLQFNVWAQIPPITLHVGTAGTLPSLISSDRMYQITDLTLTGNLNGTDIRFIRAMAGNDGYGESTDGTLENLNLAGVNIVSGGASYHMNNYTANNQISTGMFVFCGKLKSIVLPNSVTTIGEDAFELCTSLIEIIASDQSKNFSSIDGILFNKNQTTIIKFPMAKSVPSYVIPNSVTSIGNSAFCSCHKLTSINVPNSVTSIGNNTFDNCSGLININVPNSVTSIGENAFRGCTKLTSIDIPNSVTSIGKGAFSSCYGLIEILVSEQNKDYSSMDGVLFNKNKTTLIQFPIAKSGSPYVTPESVTSIGDNAFYGTNLKSISIGNRVETIGERAFFRSSLTSINIGNSVKTIGNSAFTGCVRLTSIEIPNSVTLIEGSAFSNCTGLTNIEIPNSVTSMGNWPFYGCTKLASVTIGNGITSIGSIFSGCTGLTNVTIGNGVTSIEEYDFYSCAELTSVTIGNGVKTIGNNAFYNRTRLTSIDIPNSVKTIGEKAFSNCTGLTGVTIGNSVTSIGQDAFYNCTKLTEMHSKNPTPPSLGSNCFYNVNKKTCKLYVPIGSYMAYWLAWGFDNVIEKDMSAINTVNQDNISFQSIPNGIAIETKEPTPVSVYSLSGQTVYQSVIVGNKEIPLNKGVYILRVKNESEKVIVK